LLQQGIQNIGGHSRRRHAHRQSSHPARRLLAGQPHIDRPALTAFLGQLEYPVSYLDFETIGTAIPLFDRRQTLSASAISILPAHRLPTRVPSRGFDHRQFLAERATADPRPEFMRQLRADLPETGSVVHTTPDLKPAA